MSLTLKTRSRHSASKVEDLQGLFSGFADPVRIRLLNLLAAGELCVCDLTDILGLPQSSVSRHLAYLRRAGLVETEQKGKFAHYRLSDSRTAVHRNLLDSLKSSFPAIPALNQERGRAAKRVISRALEPC
jgi:ArsR family transcriptional regulator